MSHKEIITKMFCSVLVKKCMFLLFAIFLLIGCKHEDDPKPASNDGNTTTIFNNVIWKNHPQDLLVRTISLTVPSITQDIVDKGSILVSGSFDLKFWSTFPYSYGTTNWYYHWGLNTITVNLHSSSGFSPTFEYTYIKVVVIKGNIVL